MVFAGMLPWSFFSTALADASNSLIGNANLISKVYFPRLIVPIAAVMVAFVDFRHQLRDPDGADGVVPVHAGLADLLLPVFTVLAFVASIGLGLWITALNVKYRDFRYVIPFIVQLGLYVSPVGFSSRSFRSSGVCSIRSTRWSASSTDSAGACSAAKASSTCRASASASASPSFSCGSASANSGRWNEALPI